MKHSSKVLATPNDNEAPKLEAPVTSEPTSVDQSKNKSDKTVTEETAVTKRCPLCSLWFPIKDKSEYFSHLMTHSHQDNFSTIMMREGVNHHQDVPQPAEASEENKELTTNVAEDAVNDFLRQCQSILDIPGK